jgi:serine/threonine protein kinase
MDQTALDDLVSLWQSKIARGESVAPDELCAGHPELATELARRLDVLRRAAGLAQAGIHETATAGPGPSGSTGDSRTWPATTVTPTEAPAIAGYEILSMLGRGGMGVVYKARKTQLNRVVALKMVLTGQHADPRELARFVAEAETLASLSHPNVVQLFEAGTHDGRPYFTLEYVEGGSLEAKVRRHPLPAAEAARLMEQVARGVQAAHDRGIVHRDLKPDNVLLTPDGVAKVADFGLAKRLETGEGLTRTGAVLGTPSYMAPEQARGDARAIGPTTDVWALGAILYRVLTGRPPFQAANPIQIVDQLLNAEPVAPRALQPEVPHDLETICLKCLQKDPARRYPTAGRLAGDLARFLANRPIEARPVGRVERTSKWIRRNKVLAASAAAVALSLILGTTISLLKYREAKANADQADENALRAHDQEELAKANLAKSLESETRAKREAERFEQIADLLGRMLEAPDPIKLSGAFGIGFSRGDRLTPIALVEKATAEVEARPDLDATTRGLLLQRLGNSLTGLGRHSDALRVLENSRKLLVAELGDEHPALARTYQSLGWLEYARGNLLASRDYFERSLRLQKKRLPGWEVEYTLTAIQTQYALVLAELEEYEAAMEMADMARANRVRLVGTDDDPRLAESNFALGVVALMAHDYRPALRASQAGAAVVQKNQNTDPLAYAVGLFQEGVLDHFLRNNPAAGAVKLRQALDVTRRELGDANVYTLLARAQLAVLEKEAGQNEAALANFRECFKGARELQVITHPRAVVMIEEMTDFLVRERRGADARQVVDDWLAEHRKVNSKGLGYADALTLAARVYRRTGDPARERAMLEEARSIYTTPPVVPRRQYLVNLEGLGQNYARAGRWADSEAVYTEWLDRARTWYPDRVEPHEVAEATADRAKAVFRQGRFPAELAEQLTSVLKSLNSEMRDERVRARCRLRLAEYYAYHDQPAQSVAEYRLAVKKTDQAGDLADAAEGLATAAARTAGDERAALELEALDALAKAVGLNYRGVKRIEGSAAFRALTDHPKYHELLEKMREGQ